jgi:hypothetical protein
LEEKMSRPASHEYREGKAFNRKVLAAKKNLGIALGRKNPRQPTTEHRHAQPE